MTSGRAEAVKFLVAFVALYAAGVCLLMLTIVPWTEWHLRNCSSAQPSTPTFLCDVSRPVLAYWWLFLLPVVLILAYLIAARRRRRDQKRV